MPRLLALVAVAALLAGCAHPHPAQSRGPASPAPTTVSPSASARAAPGPQPCGVRSAGSSGAGYHHVIWIWFENRSADQVAGRPSLPYLYRLGRECGMETDYLAIRHPSLPNYVAAASGHDPGPIGDCAPGACPQSGSTIFGQLGPAQWRSYDESMPAPCDPVTSGAYAARHNPAVYYANIRPACLRDDLPLSALPAALASGRLPAFTWITPNICDDMHDCSAATGDAWLAAWLPRILDSRQYRAGGTVVFITWDEGGGGSSGNQAPLYVVAPTVPRGARVATPANHFALLHTTEYLLGLPPLGSAAGAPLLAAPFGL